MTKVILPLVPSEVISISEARALGLKRYYTGVPCKHGHMAERITADRHCVECIKDKNTKQRQGKFKGYSRQWSLRNPGYHYNWADQHRQSISIYNKRNSIKRRSRGGKLSSDLRDKLMKLQRGKCACCKQGIEQRYHIDHIQPLSRGGENKDHNIQLLCPKCNMSKGFKHPIEFMQSNGYLL